MCALQVLLLALGMAVLQLLLAATLSLLDRRGLFNKH